jgi:hypothetical protein
MTGLLEGMGNKQDGFEDLQSREMHNIAAITEIKKEIRCINRRKHSHVTWVLGDSVTHTCETGILYDFRICVLTKRHD